MNFLTRKEASEYFRVSERTIDRWIESGNLKGYKFGKGRTSLLRIPKSEIKKFLEISKTNKK